MVMRPDPRLGVLTVARRRNYGPWWLWTIVVLLAVGAGYTGYLVHFSNQRLSDTATALALLRADNTGLKSSVAAVEAQLTEAQARAKAADAEAAKISDLLAKQQARADDLRAQLAVARKADASSKAEADALKEKVAELEAEATGAEQAAAQIEKLQQRIAELKSQLAASEKTVSKLKSEAQTAASAQSALERKVGALQSEIGSLRQKAEAAPAAGTQPAVP